MSVIDIDLKCSRCGDNLRGLELNAACRHCGLSVGYTFNVMVVDNDTLMIRDDCICVHCDYNLRTLALRSVCPECGKPVIDSLSATDLHYADPGWLEGVRNGTTFLLLGLTAPVLVLLAALVGASLLDGIMCPVILLALVCAPLSLLGLLAGLVGVCSTDPAQTTRGGHYAETVIPMLLVGGVGFLICGAALHSWLAQNLLLDAGGAQSRSALRLLAQRGGVG